MLPPGANAAGAAPASGASRPGSRLHPSLNGFFESLQKHVGSVRFVQAMANPQRLECVDGVRTGFLVQPATGNDHRGRQALPENRAAPQPDGIGFQAASRGNLPGNRLSSRPKRTMIRPCPR